MFRQTDLLASRAVVDQTWRDIDGYQPFPGMLNRSGSPVLWELARLSQNRAYFLQHRPVNIGLDAITG